MQVSLNSSNENSELTLLSPYDITANSYDTLYSEEQQAKYSIVLYKINIELNDRVLDAGCGTCLLYEYLISKNMSFQYYVGLDISRGMLEKCLDKRVFTDPRVDIVLGNIEETPFRINSFTKVFAFTVLDLVDKEKALSELKSLVKQGIIVYTLLKSRGCKPGIEGESSVKDCIYLLIV